MTINCEEIKKDYESPYMFKKTIVKILTMFNLGIPSAQKVYESMEQEKKAFYKNNNLVEVGVRAIPSVLVKKYLDALGITDEKIEKKLNECDGNQY
ncbi:MAG: hypothetical protein WCR67_05835 [Bacilli bacterium]